MLKQYNFLTTKPFFLILNVGDDEINGNKYTEEVRVFCEEKIFQILLYLPMLSMKFFDERGGKRRVF